MGHGPANGEPGSYTPILIHPPARYVAVFTIGITSEPCQTLGVTRVRLGGGWLWIRRYNPLLTNSTVLHPISGGVESGTEGERERERGREGDKYLGNERNVECTGYFFTLRLMKTESS
jgi:hypothetical protein